VQVAVGTLEDEVGLHALGGTHVHARGQPQVALPAHRRLQPRQQRRQREGLDVGAQRELRARAAQVHAHVVPAHRDRVGDAHAARRGMQRNQAAGGVEVQLGLQVARLHP